MYELICFTMFIQEHYFNNQEKTYLNIMQVGTSLAALEHQYNYQWDL